MVNSGDGRWKNNLKEKILKNNLRDEIKLLNSVPITKINPTLNMLMRYI